MPSTVRLPVRAQSRTVTAPGTVADPDLLPMAAEPVHSEFARDSRLAVKLPGLDLKNPVMTASGTCWYGQGIARDYDLDRLGAIVLKSTTLQPRDGNPTPRLFHGEAGWMNCNGLHNVGVEREVAEKIPWLEKNYPDLPVVASVAGSGIDEYEQVVTRLNASGHVSAVELNVSCPNVKKGGATLGTDPDTVEELTRRCKAASRVPVYVKLTPNITSIVPIARAAEKGGADGLTMINTLTGLAIDLATRRPVLSNVTGGVSGPAVKPVALRMIHEVRTVSFIPIIGVGGIRSAEDVLEFPHGRRGRRAGGLGRAGRPARPAAHHRRSAGGDGPLRHRAPRGSEKGCLKCRLRRVSEGRWKSV